MLTFMYPVSRTEYQPRLFTLKKNSGRYGAALPYGIITILSTRDIQDELLHHKGFWRRGFCLNSRHMRATRRAGAAKPLKHPKDFHQSLVPKSWVTGDEVYTKLVTL